MKETTLILLFFFNLLLHPIKLQAQHFEDNPSRLDSLLREHHHMHFYQSPTVGRADSIFHRTEKIYLYFDVDSICRQFVRKEGFNGIPDEMDYLYYAVMTEMSPEKADKVVDRMEWNAKKYKSPKLMCEVELMRVMSLPQDTDPEFDQKIACLRKLLHRAEERKDTLIQIRAMEDIFTRLHYRYRKLEAIEAAALITRLLDQVTDEQYVARRHLYFHLGEVLYQYGDYEQAILYLKKAMKSARYFFERSNLQAHINLGAHYRENDLNLSDHYYRSVLESKDLVKYRGEYDALAICGLGKNYLLRKEYRKAQHLIEKGLPVMYEMGDLPYVAGMYVALGNCALGLNDLPQTKNSIDSARLYIEKTNALVFYQELYPLMSKYYSLTGNPELANAYLDSALLRINEHQKQFNISHIFHTEKKLFEAEKNAKEQQLLAQKLKTNWYRFSLISVLSLTGLSIAFYFFYIRLRKRKNRSLYRQIIKQSQLQSKLSENKNGGSGNRNLSLDRIEELMYTEKLYTDASLTRKTLADRLETNENYVATAIREESEGRTFSEYVNTFRLEHALDRMREDHSVSIQVVAVESGFSSYKYFHKLFREQYGMSPSEFRKMPAGDAN